jgi:hypothetical protein
MTMPAYVRNGRLDILAANPLGYAFYSPVFSDPSGTPNMARFMFLNPRAQEFFQDWENVANDSVAIAAPKPDTILTTAACPTSSASCPPGAINSVAGGPHTTSKSIARA